MPYDSKERAQRIRQYLGDHCSDGASTMSWRAVAREFGVSGERVRQIAEELGIAAKLPLPVTVRHCPDCGETRTWITSASHVLTTTPCRSCFLSRVRLAPLTLQCAACGQEFERAGKLLSSYKQNLKVRERSGAYCPSCSVQCRMLHPGKRERWQGE